MLQKASLALHHLRAPECTTSVLKQQRMHRYFQQSERSELFLDIIVQHIHQLNSTNEHSMEHILPQHKIFLLQVHVLSYISCSCWKHCHNYVHGNRQD